MHRQITLIIAGLVVSVAASAHATPVTFTGSQGDLAASAEFSVSGTDLIIKLSNVSPNDVLDPPGILTAVFFDVMQAVTLTPADARLDVGSVVHFGTADPGGVVGGEWTYESGLPGAPGGALHGISSAGFGVFSSSGLFPGSNLSGPVSVDGLQYGITSAGDNVANGNAAVTGQHALIQHAMVFKLSGVPAEFDPLAQIHNVSFQYGTSLAEPNIPGVPEPATCAMLLVGGVLAGRRAVRRR